MYWRMHTCTLLRILGCKKEHKHRNPITFICFRSAYISVYFMWKIRLLGDLTKKKQSVFCNSYRCCGRSQIIARKPGPLKIQQYSLFTIIQMMALLLLQSLCTEEVLVIKLWTIRVPKLACSPLPPPFKAAPRWHFIPFNLLQRCQ